MIHAFLLNQVVSSDNLSKSPRPPYHKLHYTVLKSYQLSLCSLYLAPAYPA